MALARRALAPAPDYAKAFAQAQGGLPGARLPGLATWREASFARFTEAGIPTTRAEAWKYTNVARLAATPMSLAPKPAVRLEDVEAYLAGGPHARRLIFVNGHIVPALSHVESLPAGVRVCSLARALETEPDRVAETLRAIDDDRSFTALNAAFAGAGSWIEVGDGVTVDEPVQLLFLTQGAGEAFMCHPRIVVRLGRDARLRLIETHVGGGAGPSLTNLVSQIDLGPGALLEHDRTQQVSGEATQVGKSYLRLDAHAKLAQTVITLGGGLVRNEIEARLEGRRVECLLNGLFLLRGKEHVDNLIQVHHVAPDCHSDQFYKGVIDERGHAVFAGKVFVHKDAQKTNAYQKNDNLLLSDDAEIDTKPELEIYADDVKCSHGATAGELDPTALFYLRSRGLARNAAEAMLTFAFAAEVIDRLADGSARRLVRAAALSRLPGGDSLRELA